MFSRISEILKKEMMLKSFGKFLKYLEQWEKYEPSSFWLSIIALSICFSAVFGVLSSVSEFPYESQAVIVELRAGGSNEKVDIQKMLDSDLHRRLEAYFPDWEERMAYAEKQTEFYKSALRRKKEIIRKRMTDDSIIYSEKELDAINYFQGSGIYATYQDLSVPPNIFDTRQSFLLKMHDISAREEFLKNFNRIND